MRPLPWCLLLAVTTSPLRAQALEDRLTDLFIFGQGDEVLFLGGSAGSDNPGIQVHGDHFIPSAVEGNATIISFLANSIGSNVANLPVSASSGGETFRFEGATPVRTSISPGPIYAERAQTLGSGRLFLSLSRTGLHYETLRGVPLDAVPLVFTHANVDFPACDAIFGGDCTLYGVPEFENEVIDFTLGLDVNVDVTAFALTYSVDDRIDLGVVLPVVKTSLRGTSSATIIPFGTAGPPPHFFDLILTTGGTGLTPRDVTPEATRAALDREAPGIAEALRMSVYPRIPRAALSRGLAGVRGATLIVNLPAAPAR